MALTPPQKFSYLFTQWSLRKLRSVLIEKGTVADISFSNLQKVLTSEALSFQTVCTWKDSGDPEFEVKKRRIDILTRKRHNPHVVIVYDEMGMIELRPKGGRGWRRQGHTATVPATYTRSKGTERFLCAFNYYHGTFFRRLRRRKLSKNMLSFFVELRRHYPAEQLMHKNGQPVCTLDCRDKDMGEGEQGDTCSHAHECINAQLHRDTFQRHTEDCTVWHRFQVLGRDGRCAAESNQVQE